MKHPRKLRTLFDPDYLGHRPVVRKYSGYPYPFIVRWIEHNADERFDDIEWSAFSDVLELENHIYFGSYAQIAGPITLRIAGEKPITLDRAKSPKYLPVFVDRDALEICKCTADGVLFVERLPPSHVEQLLLSKEWKKLNWIFLSGGCLPRAPLRRMLSRLSEEYRLPVYALTDNDTWGYFALSMLNRGALAPHEQCPLLAVKKVRWLGIKSMQIKDSDLLRPWKGNWEKRLKFLKAYSCFRNPRWKREFINFERQHAKAELTPILNKLGADRFVAECIAAKIKAKDWLIV